MGAKTEINWCDATWNPIVGCSKVSAGCANCYAEKIAARFVLCRNGKEGIKGPYYDVMHYNDHFRWVWSGETVRKQPKFNPLTARKPRTIFVCSMGDLFHESVPDEWIDDVMAVIALSPHHRYMLLTKRPARMFAYISDPGTYARVVCETAKYRHRNPSLNRVPVSSFGPFWKHLAIGVSIEDQATAAYRISMLLQIPAARRFVSYEPALGPVKIRPEWLTGLDLVIMGGESGPNARPMHPDWARSMRDQCKEAGAPFHFKQWGEWHEEPIGFSEERLVELRHARWLSQAGHVAELGFGEDICNSIFIYLVGKKAAGRLLDGEEHNGTINWEN
ncbi:phage Gp37/Gp68 family protein [Chlorobium sp.]|uniref:phage Gp37/Gp68 family protein n=1 Tax=Chlorobium sp. TaxID=1095 RepID=UPI003C45AE27